MDKITIDRIKSATNIVDVIGDFIQLRKRGIEYQALCPFHDDKTLGSFSVNPVKNICHCFSCGKGGDAIYFLMEHEKMSYSDALHYLAKKYSIPVDDDYDMQRFDHVKPSTPKLLVEIQKEVMTIPKDILLGTMKDACNNSFVKWLQSLPWDTETEQERLSRTLWLYCVGNWSDGRVVFWQVDEMGRIRSGKLMTYKADGHRDKARMPGWIHNQKGVRERLDFEHTAYHATMFGMHLLRRYPTANVHIVESEKTAIICANHYGDPEANIWLACGGLKFLKLELLRPLIEQRRRIVLWPDKDGVEAWKTVKNTILDSCHEADETSITLNTEFIQKNWQPEDGPKADVADIILRIMKEAPKFEVVTDWPKDQPFIPQDEINDPELHRTRMLMSRVHSAGWGQLPACAVEGVKTVAEVLQEHPVLKPLLT